MKSVFLDTSALTAILFEESGSSELLTVLSGVENLFASNLLEAEIRSAASREGLEPQAVDRALLKVKWIHPDRALTQEIKQIISHGVYLRGADLWHLACALYFAGNPAALPFLTLDETQAQAARRLGFQVLPGDGSVEPSLSESPARYSTKPSPAKPGRKKSKSHP